MGRRGGSVTGWAIDDFRRLLAALGRRETWLFLGMAGVFAAIVAVAFHYALRLDFLLRMRNLTADACRGVGDSSAALLFIATVFFGLSLVAAFGELARYSDFKRHHAHTPARSAAWQALLWGSLALTIGLALLLMLHSQCL